MQAPSSRPSGVLLDSDFDITEPDIPAALLEYEDALAAFVREPLVLPRWLPKATWANGHSWTEDGIARLSCTYMPVTPFGDDKPDMLLYALGRLETLDESFPARLESFLSGEDHTLLVDRSGAGKTRMIFEALCRRWGLYFTCASDTIVSPYGSGDVKAAINTLEFSVDITPVLFPLNHRSRILRDKLRRNQTQTRILFSAVVLARLLVFHLFQKHVLANNVPADDARKKWLVLQLRPHQIFGPSDIFAMLMRSLRDWGQDRLSRAIRGLHRSSAAILEFVALDEAQVAGRCLDKAFTSPDRKNYRPILYQLVGDLSFLFPEQRIVVSGVEASYTVVREAIALNGSGPHLRQFSDLGMFETVEQVTKYMSHFHLTDVDCDTVSFWLRGRHRILAVFVAYCLLAGVCRWKSVLATMLHKLTGFYEMGEPLIDGHDVSLRPLLPGRLLEYADVAWNLRHALYLHVMHSQQTVTLSEDPSLVVALALGRYGSDTSTVLLDEQIVFLSLYHWLRNSQKHSFPGLLEHAHDGSLHSLQRTGFYENLGLILWHAHANGAPGREIFDVFGLRPVWNDEESFRLTLTRHADAGSRTFTPPAARYERSRLMTLARSPEDVFAWFKDAPTPFLLPDGACGADMLCIAQIAGDHHLLVCFEAGKQVLPSLRPRTRLAPTHPSQFYHQHPPIHERWLQVLRSFDSPKARSGRFSVLHVLCYGEPQSYHGPATAHVARLSHLYLTDVAHVDLRLEDIVRI